MTIQDGDLGDGDIMPFFIFVSVVICLAIPTRWLVVTWSAFLVVLVGGGVVGIQGRRPRVPEPGPPTSSKPRLPA